MVFVLVNDNNPVTLKLLHCVIYLCVYVLICLCGYIAASVASVSEI